MAGKMNFDHYEDVYTHNGEEYDTFEEAVKAALGISKQGYKVYSCSICGMTERRYEGHSGTFDCEYCKEIQDAG